MPDSHPNPPRFREIADALRREIHSGVLASGDRIPSEYQLVTRFSTTRSTVRKAVALLRAEGLVVSHQGKGAFVRTRPRVRLLSAGSRHRQHRDSGAPNYNAEVEAQGRHAAQQLREVAEVAAPDEIAARLEIAPGTPVIVRRRRFTVDDEPMQLADGYYTTAIALGTPIAEPRRVKGGVHAVLEDPQGPIRRRVARFVEDLDIRMPTPAESELLAVPPGVPVARILRTAYDTDGAALEVLDSLVPCDRHIFRYVIDVPACS
ncbi:GntR family transcriptional regulator [Streptomyces gobiensis]|uniref:GntR family transcriptional regulator n=1 Tax=Streptomyces gobiensis TaxID=2875706 RepID=UPI001E339A35|nr:GntR family transcriptional regulator [Streptomyces gobiensis]UGY91554.1 GntR family transcriptional regulator [Streptomyces gobiensis]